MPLDPHIAQILAWVTKANHPTYEQLGAAAAKVSVDKYLPTLDVKRVELAHVVDLRIPLPGDSAGTVLHARAYSRVQPSWAAPLPVILHFHGGGFTVGSVAAYENFCRFVAQHSGALVVSVDYRLAPEYKFPTAVEDCFAAYQWVLAHVHEEGGDAQRIAIMGDSAGGTLATVTCLLARDAKLPQPALQCLIYPGTSNTQDTPSHHALANGYLLTRPTIQWFFKQYLRSEADRDDWRFGPIIAPSLADIAPAWVAVAEYDPLLDEGVAYAERLRTAGVPIVLKHYAGQIHGFFNMGGYAPSAKAAVFESITVLKEALTLS
jgi:acetyl esterase